MLEFISHIMQTRDAFRALIVSERTDHGVCRREISLAPEPQADALSDVVP
jgi:hypothetical protein